MNRRNWRLRFRLGYLQEYGWRKEFAFGVSLGPLLFYRKDEIVYVKRYVTKDAILTSLVDIPRYTQEEAKKNLYNSIPYDFVFPSIESFTDYDIDRNLHVYLIQGVPRPT